MCNDRRTVNNGDVTMPKSKTFKVGDAVKLFLRSYVRGSRRPGCPNGKFTYRQHRLKTGILLAKDDPRAHVGTLTAGWSAEQLRQHFASHVGLANAVGGESNGLTDGNNPVLMPDGEVLWVYREQVR